MKPRSLRFTWSMKTTSAMEPTQMMQEIYKVLQAHNVQVGTRVKKKSFVPTVPLKLREYVLVCFMCLYLSLAWPLIYVSKKFEDFYEIRFRHWLHCTFFVNPNPSIFKPTSNFFSYDSKFIWIGTGCHFSQLCISVVDRLKGGTASLQRICK